MSSGTTPGENADFDESDFDLDGPQHFREPRFRLLADGSAMVSLETYERDLLKRLPLQLRELLQSTEPEHAGALVRLFPPAYLEDPEKNAEFEQLMRSDLVERKVAVAEMLSETADAAVLTEAQLAAWMGAINDIRLVIGTQLDIREDRDPDEIDEDDPRFPAVMLYGYFTHLLTELVDALEETLPEPVPDDG